jgi:hypothetical protein
VAEGRQRNQGVFSGMVRGVSNPREGSNMLTVLYRPRLVCRARSYISEARGRLILRSWTSVLRNSKKFARGKLESDAPDAGARLTPPS